MDEREWLACTDPETMLWCVNFKSYDRKLRLFALAYCRRNWHLLGAEWQRVVETCERAADDLATREDAEQAWDQAGEQTFGHIIPPPRGAEDGDVRETAARMAYYATAPVVFRSGTIVSKGREAASSVVAIARGDPLPTGQWDERGAELSRLLRENIGPLPFRFVAFDLALRVHTVLALAQAAYDHRQLPSGHLEPERLAILADALEEAGCDNAEILSHLRGIGPHVRGCWCLDLILGAK